jgi:hypothetical protein
MQANDASQPDPTQSSMAVLANAAVRSRNKLRGADCTAVFTRQTSKNAAQVPRYHEANQKYTFIHTFL